MKWIKKKLFKQKINFPNKACFLITSSGQMGTFWLASQLNKHPELFCSHAYDKPVWGAKGAPLTGQAGERQRENIKKYFPYLSLSEFFAEQSAATNKRFIGNAHAYNSDRALELINKEKLKSIKVVNLIRHPISRIYSAVNCIRNEWQEGYIDHLSFVPKMYHEHGRPLVKALFNDKLAEIDDSLSKQFFIVSTMHERGSAYHARTAQQNDMLNIKYEDITTEPATMRTLIHYVTNGQIDATDWVNQHVTYKKVNAHSGAVSDNIQTRFNQWEPWQQMFYQHIIASDDNFRIYDGVYDLMCVKRHSHLSSPPPSGDPFKL